jgi:hypothetical protein
MEAIDKANELIEMFRMDNTAEGESRAIKCALIAVHEIINAIRPFGDRNWWQEVKKEIKKCE